MKVREQYLDVKTGQRGQREIDAPAGVVTVEEGVRLQAALEREERRAELRAQMQAALADQALGLDVTDRIQKLREAYQKL